MTLKEQLEFLRGESIALRARVEDIPCIETSDLAKLCKAPVVSVQMITYNHEPYIRQAIEGVMMQKTDFEFELVIGEDCSTDKTREVCFEYQKKYPAKIRVLWSEHNVNHVGGNSPRSLARCRGEFIALCEGDDYWIDPFKLQKQVDAMRKYPNVGICFCGALIHSCKDGKWKMWGGTGNGFEPGMINSKKYMLFSMFGKEPGTWGAEFFQMTATFLVRAAVLKKAQERYELFKWRLLVGDGVFSMGVGSLSDAYYLQDVVSVYRQTSTGASITNAERGFVDALIIRLYYLSEAMGLSLADVPEKMKAKFIDSRLSYLRRTRGPGVARDYLSHVFKNPEVSRDFKFSALWLRWSMARYGFNAFIDYVDRWVHRFLCPYKVSLALDRAYAEAGAGDYNRRIYSRESIFAWMVRQVARGVYRLAGGH